eukprot:CAMPEP_0197608102 /NCGR_PEP_ID=MMETSP1326-20131121/48388_1 /TAXON_ID=1155430 /ORGANISM="Genus nov. species nov., Strain RCC2288" /LENGTH=70 /DNA_ID=CAMNT_0043176261 /DNA_START=27 /DNA_END=236 /DNA_ORIENTATION=-
MTQVRRRCLGLTTCLVTAADMRDMFGGVASSSSGVAMPCPGEDMELSVIAKCKKAVTPEPLKQAALETDA